MPTFLDVAALAREMKAAQDESRQVPLLTARFPGFDLDTAYDVARRVHRERIAEGARPVGRKIGFTNPAMWAQYGVREPIWAFVYDRTVEHLSGTRAACSLAGLVEPKIEPEIVLHFHSPPVAGAGMAEVLGAIDWVAHGYEVVQSHFAGWKFEAPDAVADGSLRGRLFVGPPRPLDSLGGNAAAALESFTLALACDGRPVEAGRGSNVLGSPLLAIVHLVKALAERSGSEPLQAGELVTTGTITAAHAVRPGETWRSQIQGIALPGLEIAFQA